MNGILGQCLNLKLKDWEVKIMKRLLNCSNHVMGLEQIRELENKGYVIVELPEDLKKRWAQMDPETYGRTCNDIIEWAEENDINAMHLAGFPAAVVLVCADIDRIPLYYAYSERVSIEETLEDGSVVKKNVFRHKGFYQYKTF